MKKAFVLLICFLLIGSKCYAQFGKYESFYNYIIGGVKTPKSVRENCAWQLAMVKVKTNKAGRVISLRSDQ